MTKERWEQLKDRLPISLDVWWEYYKERGGKLDDVEAFRQAFTKAINSSMVVSNTQGSLVRITDESAYRSLCNYYNEKYDLT